jgi:hypothetical protein
MSSPVTADDIVSGATKYLRAQPEVIAAVSTFVIGGQPTPGIFGYTPWAPIEGSSGTAVVLSSEGGWTGPNTHNTLRFPRLTVNIWADPMRDGGRNSANSGEVMKRAFATYRVVDRYLHRVAGPEVFFGGLRVIECLRLTEPVIYLVPDGDGLVRCQVFYALTEG